jgi:hypothetical protein
LTVSGDRTFLSIESADALRPAITRTAARAAASVAEVHTNVRSCEQYDKAVEPIATNCSGFDGLPGIPSCDVHDRMLDLLRERCFDESG